MTNAVFIPWENKLGQIMREPGGVRVGEAMERADRNLESIKDECLGEMDKELAELEALCNEGGRHPEDPLKRRIYDISNDLVAVAGAFGLSELGQAAFSLCELVDRLRGLGKWSQAAVEVHLSSCRLLRQHAPGEDRSSVIEGLRSLTMRAAAIAE
jgi:hypothetical protein